MYINDTTQLWQFCDSWMYYHRTQSEWLGKHFSNYYTLFLECGDSWIYDCQYQTHCFECPDGQTFDLDELECIDTCPDEKIQKQSDAIHGLDVCRKLDYYVNPLSESVLELGTRLHPYKNINILFRDLFNFGAGSGKSITIHLLLDAYHFISHHDALLYDMADITFTPYTISQYGTFDVTGSDQKTSIFFRNGGKFTIFGH